MDEDEARRSRLARRLEGMGFSVRTMQTLDEVMASGVVAASFEGMILAQSLPGAGGAPGLLDFARAVDTQLPLVLVTHEDGVATFRSGLDAMRRGVFDFIEAQEQEQPEQLFKLVYCALQRRREGLIHREVMARRGPPEQDVDAPAPIVPARSLRERTDDFERMIVMDALRRNDFHVRRTAQELGLDWRRLFERIARLGIALKHQRGEHRRARAQGAPSDGHSAPGNSFTLHEMTQAFQTMIVLEELEMVRFNVRRAAPRLGMKWRTLYEVIGPRRLNIELPARAQRKPRPPGTSDPEPGEDA